MYYVYILHSVTCDRYYCGFSEDVERRVAQHNDPNYTLSKTTKRWPGPWRLVWQSNALSGRGDAMVLERDIKKRGMKRYLADKELSMNQAVAENCPSGAD